MAVMTTQQSEGALPNEKHAQATPPAGNESTNGSLEVNGHTSPTPTKRESDTGNAPTSNGETLVADAKSGKDQDQDQPPAKQALPDETKHDDQPAVPKGKSGDDIARDMDKVNMEDAAAAASTADTDMPDAPVDRPAEEDKMSEGLSPKSHPHPEPETKPDSEGKDQKEPTADGVEISADSALPDGKTNEKANEKTDDKADDKADDRADVAMADTEEKAQTEAAATAAPTENTQETAVTAATPASPKGADIPAADSQVATDATAGTPPALATADTSMSDAAQPSAKVSRERDIDSEDEPVAKRTKVDRAEDQVQVRLGRPEERMDVDKQAPPNRPSPYRANGQPKKLDDDSLNDSPITEWQNKQIRQVLAGVKKTKVGALFRLPVQHLWPQLWTDYSVKISNPTDISTMEKRLRGDLRQYATMGDFKKDLDLMVQNAVIFNGEIHDVTNGARACRDAILGRMALHNAAEPTKPERKESSKAHTTRHAEPRPNAPPLSTVGVARPFKSGIASPAPKPVPESPAFALPPGSNGVPLIRRDSSKPDSRAKRPVKPAHPKDLVYDTKRKKKLPLELRFCDELLTELRKTKHYDINAAFNQPVDPVALNIPAYHKIIKKPMDLLTMANKLGSGEYSSAKEFERDFDLIIKNCRTFNGEDHLVYAQALRLQDLYRAEMSKKDEWMAKHAPVSAAVTSHGARDDSESDGADSEADSEHDEERKQVENRLATIQKRLDVEQKKVNDMVNSGTSDISEVEIAQSVVAMLQRNLMAERAKLANLPAKKPGKPKPAKAKKMGGGAPANKRASGAIGPAGAPKKHVPKKPAPKRKIGQVEKEIIIDSLGNLDGPLLERAIDLIKKDTGHSENDAGELELDIETVSEEALVRLYDIALKANPNARIEKERQLGLHTSPSSDPPIAAAAAKAKQLPKSKKNKPMSKSEQERRIQQLNELRAQAGRQASGSQEPLDSIEGNGNEPAAQPEHESEDEVDSEED